MCGGAVSAAKFGTRAVSQKRTHLPLPAEPSHLLQPSPCGPTLENTMILLRVDVQRFVLVLGRSVFQHGRDAPYAYPSATTRDAAFSFSVIVPTNIVPLVFFAFLPLFIM